MCREALAAYLSRAVEGLSHERIGWLLDEAETGEPARDEASHERLTYRDISYDLHQRIERALQSVRVVALSHIPARSAAATCDRAAAA